MDYRTGDCVVFGLHGVCRLLGTETEEKSGQQHYVLQPVSDSRSRLYVPLEGEATSLRMKPLLSEEEVRAMMEGIRTEKDIWIANEFQRKEVYHEIVRRGDRHELLQLIKTLFCQQKLLKQSGKRLHRIDEKSFKDAKKILIGEFAYVLGLDPAETEEAVLSLMEAE